MNNPSSHRARRAPAQSPGRVIRGRCAPSCLAAAAAAAAIFISKPLHADTFYLQRPGTSDWNSTSDGYFTWLDESTLSLSTLPPPGSTVFVDQSGVLGMSGAVVNFNYAYGATGLAALTIGSGNQLSQTSAATAMLVNGDTIIGDVTNTTGTYLQSASSASFNNVYLGSNGAGVYLLSGGFASFANTLYVGYGASGSFTQTGGSNVSSVVAIGYTNGSFGIYSLSNQGSLNAGQLIVGWYASGLYNQFGGVASVGTNGMFVGALPGSSGTVNVSGGSLSVSGFLTDGDSGNGVINQSGGTVHASYLGIGFSANGTSPASVGTYSLSNSANLLIDNDLAVGESGIGFYNQSGGSASTGGFFLVGYLAGSSGSANLSGGYLGVNGEVVGYDGTGQIYQSGGTNSIVGGNSLTVGQNVGSSGTYTLAGGVLTGPFDSFIGYAGHGNFVQSGGSHTAVDVILGYSNGASGSYSLSQGTLTSDNLTVGWNGSGFFSQSGGSNTVNTLYISYSNGSSGTYSLSGGMLSSGLTPNNGLFTQSGGTASLSAVSGSGTMLLGGGAELTKVTRFQQGNLTINSGGFLAVATNAAAATNSATTLAISGSGQLDLSNNNLLTTTSSSTIRQYLVNGFNNGAWNGTGGITSVNAAADFTSNGASAIRALGYSSGTTIASLGLASNQTLVKFTMYGDADLSGGVDISDLNIVLNNFLGGGTWDTGDFFYSGTTDISDLNAVLNNFFASAPTSVKSASLAKAHTAVSTAHTLTGTASPAANPPTPAFNTLELVVNTSTGDVQIIGNNTQTGDTQITSSSNGIITANWHDLKSQGFSNWQDTAKKAFGIGEFDTQFAATGDFALINDVDYGNIYNTTANAEDYIFKYGAVDQTTGLLDTLTGSVFYVSGVPEPTTLSLIGIGAVGLLARRRKNRNCGSPS